MFTLVGAGIKTLQESCRKMATLIPPQAEWLQTSVSEFHPDENYIVTADGGKVGYEYLIVAVGLQVNFDKVCVFVRLNHKVTYNNYYLYSRLKVLQKLCKIPTPMSPATIPQKLPRRLLTMLGSSAAVTRYSPFPHCRSSAPGLPRRSCTLLRTTGGRHVNYV